jgi:hypothetical protein
MDNTRKFTSSCTNGRTRNESLYSQYTLMSNPYYGMRRMIPSFIPFTWVWCHQTLLFPVWTYIPSAITNLFPKLFLSLHAGKTKFLDLTASAWRLLWCIWILTITIFGSMDNLDSYKIYRHHFVNLVLLCSFGGEFKSFL